MATANFLQPNRILFHCFIPGRAYLKKSTMRVFGYGRSKRVVYSANYGVWEIGALAYITRARMQLGINQPLNHLLHMRCLFQFKNQQAEPDLSACYEGIQDVLQKAKVIENDRLIMSHDGSRKLFHQKDVGLWVELYKFEEGS